MALKTWTTQYPGALDTTTQMPTVVDGDDTDDTQLNTIGTVLRQLETEIGKTSPDAGSIKYRLDDLEAVSHWESADINTGLGTTTHFAHNNNQTMALVAQNPALDADGQEVIASVFDRNASALDWASSLRLHTFGWVNDSNAYQEMASIRGSGDFYAVGKVQAGGQLTLHANVDAGYGMTGDHLYTASALEVVFGSNRTDSAGNRVYTFVGYTGTGSNFVQASTMRLASWGYTTSTPTYNEVAAVYADGDISCVELRAGAVQCTNSASGINVASVLKIDSSYDRSVGLGGASTNLAKVTADTEFALIHTTRGDSADNRVFTAVYAPGADTLSAEATIRLLSVGWSTTTPTYQEKFSVRANGDIWCARDIHATNAGYFPDSVIIGTTRITRSPDVEGDAGILDINAAAQELVLLHRNRTDAVDNRVVTIGADTNLAGNFTQAGSMRLLSVGYVDTVGPDYNEVFAVYGDGDIYVKSVEATGIVSCYSNHLGMKALASGASNFMGTDVITYGLYTTTSTETMGFWSVAASGSGEVSFTFAADVAASSIASDHIVCQWGWTSDGDVYDRLMHLEGDGTLELEGTGSSTIEGQEADGATAVGLLVSTGSTYSTAGSKLLSVQNNYSEEFYVDYAGHAVANYVTAGGSSAYLSAGSSLYMQSNTDRTLASTGDLAGVADHLLTITNYPLIISSTSASRDVANAFITAVVYDRGGATWTNAATSRIMSWGWTNDSDVFQELAYVRGDGNFIASAGIAAGTGLYTTSGSINIGNAFYMVITSASGVDSASCEEVVSATTSRPGVLRGIRTDAASNTVWATTWDAETDSPSNLASIRIHSFGWTQDTDDTYNEKAYVRGDGLIYAEALYCATGGQFDSGLIQIDNQPTYFGINSTGIRCASASDEFHIFHQNRTDSANNRCVTLGGRTSTTGNYAQAATMRLLSVGYCTTTPTYTEMFYILADGSFGSDYAHAIGEADPAGKGSLTLRNSEPATVSVNQWAPAIYQAGQAWETTGGSSDEVILRMLMTPIDGAAASGKIYWDFSIDGGAYSSAASLTSAGGFTAATITGTSYLTSSGYISATSYVATNTYLQVGTTSNGIYVGTTCYGVTGRSIYTENVGHTMQIRGTYASGSGNIGIAFESDVNAASIDANHKVTAWGWINNSDTRAELAFLSADGGLTLNAANASGAVGTHSGAAMKIANKQELVSIAAAATTSSTITIPDDCLFLGYSIRVVTQPTGTTSTHVGVSGDAQRFGTSISTTAGTTDGNCSDAHDRYSGGPTAILFTPNATPSAADGEIRLTIHYVEFTAATA